MKYEPNTTNWPSFITVDNYKETGLVSQIGWHFGAPRDLGKRDKHTTGVFYIKYKNQ